jgi:hypothetical protein
MNPIVEKLRALAVALTPSNVAYMQGVGDLHAWLDRAKGTISETANLIERLAPIGDGIEPRGCPTPGACSCPVARRTAPAEGVEYETTAEDRAAVPTWRTINGDSPFMARLLRDFDRQAAHIAILNAALAAEKERADAAEERERLGLAISRGWITDATRAEVALATSEAAREKLEAALREIAAYDDTGANERLAKTGSYGSFDEPGSVQIARAALDQLARLIQTKEGG